MYSSLDDIEEKDEATGAAPGTFGAVIANKFLPPPKNYAEDEKIQEWVRTELWYLARWTRQDRQVLQEEWHNIRDMVLLRHNDSRRYIGDSDYYLPLYARNKATLLSAYSRGLFPSDEYIDVGTYDPSVTPEDAQNVKLYLQWELDVNASARNKMKEFLGQYVDYGISPMKVLYKKSRRVQGGYSSGGNAQFQQCYQDGLCIVPSNLFNWYIYPTTASSVDESTLIFEDVEISKQFAEQMVREEKWVKNAMELLQSSSYVSEQRYAQQRMMEVRGTQPPVQNGTMGEQGERYVVTECWTETVLPRAAYIDGVDYKDAPLPVRVVMTSAGEPLSAIRNPNWHQKPPYLVARANQEPGYFYGYNYGRMTQSLQYLANDSANQMNDNAIYALNPFAIINPSLLLGPPPPMSPGATLYSNNVDKAIKFDRPPMEQVQLGVQLMQMWAGMCQDLGGAPAILQGAQGSGRAAKTATGAQIAQKNAQTPIQDLVEDIETSVLIPLLDMAYTNAQQYREQEVMGVVTGRSFKVTPDQLKIKASFRWMASSQAVNNQVRAQQAISLMQAIAPLVPLLQQQGKKVDFTPLIKRVYQDGFGFRGFEQFIQTPPPPPPGMVGAGLPGQPALPGNSPPGTGQPPDGDRARSALEQLYGQFGGQEAQPGEAEEFMNVRQNADDLAAQAGSGGGMPS